VVVFQHVRKTAGTALRETLRSTLARIRYGPTAEEKDKLAAWMKPFTTAFLRWSGGGWHTSWSHCRVFSPLLRGRSEHLDGQRANRPDASRYYFFREQHDGALRIFAPTGSPASGRR